MFAIGKAKTTKFCLTSEVGIWSSWQVVAEGFLVMFCTSAGLVIRERSVRQSSGMSDKDRLLKRILLIIHRCLICREVRGGCLCYADGSEVVR